MFIMVLFAHILAVIIKTNSAKTYLQFSFRSTYKKWKIFDEIKHFYFTFMIFESSPFLGSFIDAFTFYTLPITFNMTVMLTGS